MKVPEDNMEENYYKKIKYELKNIRNQRKIIHERLDKFYFYKNPLTFMREFINSGNISRIGTIKNNLYTRDNELSTKYSNLRSEYSNRFDYLKIPELIVKYEEIHKRVKDLEKRAYKIKSKKIKARGSSRKKLVSILNEIETEQARRGRVLKDIVHEFESDRKITLEEIYLD